jgi:hypothetical protein
MNSVGAPAATLAALDDHLTAPSAAGWRLWRTAECRGAGFPLATVLDLADPACGRAADALSAAAARSANLWQSARERHKATIKNRVQRLSGMPADEPQTQALQREIRELRAVAKAIDRHVLNAGVTEHVGADAARELATAEQQLNHATEEFLRTYALATVRFRHAARELANDDRFREAICWQNRRALQTCLDFLAQDDGSSSRTRRSEELIATYAQRYATKNDTIGFFGPVGWAWLVDRARGVALHPGPALLSARSVYFEDWAVRAVAAHLSTDQRLRPWMIPRKMPHLRLEKEALRLPGGAQVRLSEQDSAALSACDGSVNSRQLAEALMANPFSPFDSETQVLTALERLAETQRISWGFPVPAGDPWPERALQAQLAQIDQPALRAAALEPLESLLEARARVAAARGNPTQLQNGRLQLEETFTRVSGRAAEHNSGQAYGGRGIVYEDCKRDMTLEIGEPLREQLHPPLDLILASARWYCHELGKLFRTAFEQLFANARPAGGGLRSNTVPFADFWLRAQTLFFGDRPLDATALRKSLAMKWERILDLPDGARAVARDSAKLAAQVSLEFRAPDCGWRSARHHSPDVMIQAADVAAIEHGEYSLVLGELHLGINTLIVQSALSQHPDPESILQGLRADLGAPRILPILSPEATQRPIRVQTVPHRGWDVELCFAHDAQPLDAHRHLDSSDLVVEQRDGALLARTGDGRRTFDLMDVFGELLSGYAANHFRLVTPAAHQPRITLDRLVIQRESWRMPCSTLPFVTAKDAAQGYLEARRWARTHEMPRWVFVKTPWERKPVYVDFDSPLYIRMLARQVRNALERGESPNGEIVISEMLPAHGQAWLIDASGQSYTSELRFVAVYDGDIARRES